MAVVPQSLLRPSKVGAMPMNGALDMHSIRRGQSAYQIWVASVTFGDSAGNLLAVYRDFLGSDDPQANAIT
jgi:hypothetical protein